MSIVAEHYNKLNGSNLETRSESKIYYMRNFNNWIKSVLISEYIKRIRAEKNDNKVSVFDLGSGKGGDIKKWVKSNVNRVTFADLAEKSIEECKNRYENPMKARFEAEFIHLDATTELIRNKITSDNLKHDLVSSQFVIHYSFESYEKADNFLQNVSDALQTGGYFIGTTTNANEIVKRLRESKNNSFGNELYNIKFEKQDREEFPLFGDKFNFQLENVVENCPEYLINFDCLELMAQKHNLKLVFCNTFSEYFESNSKTCEYKNLISIMSALEPIYSKHFDKTGLGSNEYEFVKEYLEKSNEKDDLKDDEQYVTMSKSEWEVATLYLVFAFVKVDPNEKKTDSKEEESILKRKLSNSTSEEEIYNKHSRV